MRQDQDAAPPSARTFSTGYGHARLQSYLALLRHFRGNPGFARRHYEIFRQVTDAFRKYGVVPIDQATVLEIGCGQRYPLTLLLHASGARVVGIDIDYVDPDRTLRPGSIIAAWRRNGPERAIKTAARRTLFDRSYYRALEQAFGRALSRDRVDLRVMDARTLGFADGSFDYACSSDVFEHIDGVEQASSEMARVLK